MTLNDKWIIGEKNEDSSILENEWPPRTKEHESYDNIAREENFGDYFWKPADPPTWPYGKEILVTASVLWFCVLIEFIVILLVGVDSIGPLVLGCILVVVLLGANIREATFSRFLLSRRRNNMQIIDLKLNQQLECSFLEEDNNVLFIRDGQYLIALGLFRLRAVAIQGDGSKERLIRAIYQQQVPLYWIHYQIPVMIKEFIDDNFPAIRDKARSSYSRDPPHRRAARIGTHGGIWGGRIVLGSQRILPAYRDSESSRRILIKLINDDLFKIHSVFKQTISHSILKPLKGNDLIAAYRFSIQGDPPVTFYESGYEAVEQFIRLPQLVAKSVKHYLPSEFIEPTRVPHNVNLGKVFSAEFQQQEVPAGLVSPDMLKGVLVIGGTRQQRFRTNTKLVHAAGEQKMNYLIITDDPSWRCMLDYISNACLMRLGPDLLLNPLDPEENEVRAYSLLLAQVFAQCFPLTATGYERLSNVISTSLERPTVTGDLELIASSIGDLVVGPRSEAERDLGAVYRFLENLRLGKISTMLGIANLPINKLLQGINIIEIDIKDQKYLQFLSLCLLAKLLAYSQTNPDHKFMVLVDMSDVLVPLDPLTYRARETEQFLLEWVRRFRQSSAGLHLSLQTPSRFAKDVLNVFPNILAHRTSPKDDIERLEDLLQLLPEHVVLSRGVRHNNWQTDYLKELPLNHLVMKHPAITNGFPVQLAPLDLSWIQPWSPEDIQLRLTEFFPTWKPIEPDMRTLLERDFPRDLSIVLKLIELLGDYEEVNTQGILSSLTGGDSQSSLDMPALQIILHQLKEKGYIIHDLRDPEGTGRHTYYRYRLKDKAREEYMNYQKAFQERLQQLRSDYREGDEFLL